MINKIKAYLDHAFQDAPDTKKVNELKEELYANLIEKYNDQLTAGKSEQEAYNAAISGIGDISEMIDMLRTVNTHNTHGIGLNESTQKIRKRAGLVAIGVCFFIASPIPIIFFSVHGDPITGLCLLLLMVAIGVGLIVYAQMTKQKYIKSDDTMVEDFKEWRSKSYSRQSSYQAFRSGYWALVVAIYLIISFLTFDWHITWIIFIIAVAVEHVIRGVIQLNEEKGEQDE